MKRIACLMVLMALSSPASARDSYFTFRGHRIHLQTVRHCRSLSCIALSIPGIHRRRGRDWDADDVANTADPAQTPAPAQAQPAPAPAQIQPPPAPVQAQPSPAPAQPRPAPLIAQAAPAPVTRAPAAPIPVAAAPAPAPVQTRPVPASTLAAVAPIVQVAPPASKSAVQVTNSTPPPAPPSVGFDVAKPRTSRRRGLPSRRNPRHRLHHRSRAPRKRATTQPSTRRSGIGRPKARAGWFASNPAAKPCAATCSMRRRGRRAKPSSST